MHYIDKGQLSWVWQNRQRKNRCHRIGDDVGSFVKRWIVPRRKKLAAVGQVWQSLLPPELVEHSCLESLQRGQLRVLVDSAPHLAELNMLVRCGLVDQLRELCPNTAVNRIKLVRGRWSHCNEEGNAVAEFD